MTLFELLQKEIEKSQDVFEQKIEDGKIESIFYDWYEDEELLKDEQEDYV